MLHNSSPLRPACALPPSFGCAALTIDIERREVGRAHTVAFARCAELLLSGVEEVGDAQAEGTALVPAAVGEGWIVGAGRGEVPLLVGGVEARTVSGRDVSARTSKESTSPLSYLATITTAGGRAMLMSYVLSPAFRLTWTSRFRPCITASYCVASAHDVGCVAVRSPSPRNLQDDMSSGFGSSESLAAKETRHVRVGVDACCTLTHRRCRVLDGDAEDGQTRGRMCMTRQ